MAELTNESVLAELKPVFEDILNVPDLDLNRATTASQIPEWDSLAHLEIIEVVQYKYKVKFTLPDQERLKTVGDLVDLVLEKSAR
jgi:acyl carrier protein